MGIFIFGSVRGVQRVRYQYCQKRSVSLPSGTRPSNNGLPRSIFQNQNIRSLTLEQLKTRDSWGGRDRERVVILGSGWAGYNFARHLDHHKYHAVIVSPRSYFVFTPLLASTSVGTLEFRTALEPVRSNRTKADFFQGWADSVDFYNKKITIEEAVDDPHLGLAMTGSRHDDTPIQLGGRKFDLPYDKLVIAVGCYSQTFNIPGVRENALFLKDIGDARRIRQRIMACFERAALPTTPEKLKRHFLNFAIVGGGPTGIEFSAELHDFVTEDLAKHFPELIDLYNITVYDVAPTVLPMFDENLGKYAMQHFSREGINIKTSHRIQELRKGAPTADQGKWDAIDEQSCWTLKIQEEGEVGVGMVVWSTGLMNNPFVGEALGIEHKLASAGVKSLEMDSSTISEKSWVVKKDPKTGSIITDEHLRLALHPKSSKEKNEMVVLEDVFAIGDCASIDGTTHPATAQVASQKAEWLARSLNRGEFRGEGFLWNNLGVMAYLGNWRAIFQSDITGDISGRTAFLLWRGAYVTKSVSLKNKILIPVYWLLNWLFGRDISRF